MKKWIFTCFVVLGFMLTGCIEIIDDLKLNIDGSGSFKYSINLSSSKVKINSILALDSLDGERVPSKEEISEKINNFKYNLGQKEGISNVIIEEDYSNFIFKISCDFENLSLLQTAIKRTVSDLVKHQKNELDEHQWVEWHENSLERSVPQIALDQIKKLKQDDIELLKDGTYTNITRFEKEVKSFDNDASVLSKNKKAVMLRVNTFSLTKDANLLHNKITLVD
ncbi:MAG: hypothetical protein M9916_05900 [Crocinitomicaceae bacterium]|nr:hypothetical protein [Crocinitomicaceae bacterium]